MRDLVRLNMAAGHATTSTDPVSEAEKPVILDRAPGEGESMDYFAGK